MAALPDWVLKHKTKGVAIEKRGDRFYATRITSVWDKEKKRPVKKTLEYLGVVTPEGIVPPKHKQPINLGGILEAGNIQLIRHFTKDLEAPLRRHFPNEWQTILAAATLRIAYGSPLGRMKFHHDTSATSQYWPRAHLSKNTATKLLETIGRANIARLRFYEDVRDGESYIAVDLSHVLSTSQKNPLVEYGRHGTGDLVDQVALVLLWCMEKKVPGYLHLLPGAIADASTLVESVQESGIKDAIVVGDRGFYSAKNESSLIQAGLGYVLAMSRNMGFLEHRPHSEFTNHFLYNDRVQWCRVQQLDPARQVVWFLDKEIAAREEKTFLQSIAKGDATKAEWKERRWMFGTIGILTNTGMAPEKVWQLYRERGRIEDAFRLLKGPLGADQTHMQSAMAMEGYFFILFIALHIYTRMIDHAKRKGILDGLGMPDILWRLSKVYAVDIDGTWIARPRSKQVQRLIDGLEVPITENLGD